MAALELVPMTEEQYLQYRHRAEISYAHDIAASGAVPLPEAQEKSRQDYDRLLPGGLATEGHHLWTAYEGDVEIGMLWLHLERKSDGLHAFGYDFYVESDLRRKGYGRAIMQAAEQLCREWGVVSVGLSVFGFNFGARDLYEQMGYEVTAIQMRKRL
ncbi:GNAT family N-acetyltransferase [Micromonospora sp. NPDC000668]|uniref:GNAT family N-acetyltransferase n=1 Tax=Micromonospora sp. NPDC000668 TaxID=3364219 RepID=UPI0036B52F09